MDNPKGGQPHGRATPRVGNPTEEQQQGWATPQLLENEGPQPLGMHRRRTEQRPQRCAFARLALTCSCCKAFTKAFFSLLVCSAFRAFFWLDVMHCSHRIFPFFSCFQCGVKSVRH